MSPANSSDLESKIVCQFRDERTAFVGELPIGNASTAVFFGQADFQAVIVWKDNFAAEKNAGKMQDKHSQKQEERGPVRHGRQLADRSSVIIAVRSDKFFIR